MLDRNYFIAKRINYLMEKLVKVTFQLEDRVNKELEQKNKKAA